MAHTGGTDGRNSSETTEDSQSNATEDPMWMLVGESVAS
jgi:hypothetical protein